VLLNNVTDRTLLLSTVIL